MEPNGEAGAYSSEIRFLRRLLIVVAAGVIVYLSWRLADVLMLAFAAVIVAIVLRAFALPFTKYLQIPDVWAVAVAGVLVLGLIGTVATIFGSQVQEQGRQLAERFPTALSQISQQFGLPQLGELLSGQGGEAKAGVPEQLISRLTSLGSAIIGGLANLLLVTIAGVYAAMSYKMYRVGTVRLFPAYLRPRIDDALITSGLALHQWLIGQLIAMLAVGTLVATGLWWIGVPSALALGLIAGITEFIPYLGPWLGAIPAVIIAASQDWNTGAWTVGLFVAIQLAENYLITPLIARRMVSIPPALGLFAVVAFGVLFGPLGLFLAFPLTVVTMVLITKLYLQAELGEDIAAPGERPDR